MATARKQIKFGVPFTISVNNFREHEFEVANFHDQKFDQLACAIKNTTTLPPPTVYVTDAINGIIKLIFHPKTPINAGLELLVKDGVAQKVEVTEQRILFPDGAIAGKFRSATSGSWLTIKKMFWGFLLASTVFWFVKGTVFGDWVIGVWSKINAAQVIQMADELDPRILTNRHAVYESAGFTQFNAVYKASFGADKNLKNLYRFVGNGFFVTADLVKDRNGGYLRLEREDAEELCETIAGRLLSVEELPAYLAGQYLTVENPAWPVSLRSNEPEWSKTKASSMFGDDYYVYLKDSENPNPRKTVTADKFVSLDEDDYKLAFRCGFEEKTFVETE